MKLDQAYERHQVFPQLQRYAEFYESLSDSVFRFITPGTKAAYNIDSYLYSSMQGTLESIKHILLSARIGDSYALLRKFYDSAIINIYSNLYLNNNFSIENIVVGKIHDWLNGKQPLPRFGPMSKYIRESPSFKRINDLLYVDKRYSDLRTRCNGYMHFNSFSDVLYNDNQVYLKDRMNALDGFSKDLENLLIFHLSYLFCLNEHYMASSDYLDFMECGQTPPQDSQYWVAPFVQEIFDSVIKKGRMDIATEIKSSSTMKIK